MIDEVRGLEAAESQLNAFVERQASKVKEARAGQERQNAIEAMWRAGEERALERRRVENRALWFAHYSGMAASHRKLSEEYERKAEQLCEGGTAA